MSKSNLLTTRVRLVRQSAQVWAIATHAIHRTAENVDPSKVDFSTRLNIANGLLESVTSAADDVKRAAISLAELCEKQGIDCPAVREVAIAPAWLMEKKNTDRAQMLADELNHIETATPNKPKKESSQYSFIKIGSYWDIAFDGEHGHFGKKIGFRMIHTLLRFQNPSKPVTVADLRGKEAGNSPIELSSQSIVDEQALKSCNEEIAELNRGIEEASSDGDEAKAERLQREKDEILNCVRLAIGLGGKSRKFNRDKAAEAAKKNVLRVRKEIAEEMPGLAEHFRTSIKIGDECAYTPGVPISWRLDKNN
jgi:hypothetical protein